MIRRLSLVRLVLLAATAISPAALAAAADLDDEIQAEAGVTPVEYASGWYLRGDIGTFHGAGNVTYILGGAQEFNGSAFFEDVAVGVGVGYIFNDRLRADFTISHFGGLSLGGSSSLGSCGAGFTGECFYNTSASVNFTDLSLNGYWNLGNWSTIKPYVGAGIGLALVRWDDYNSQPFCALDPGETCAGATHSGGLTQEILASGGALTSHGRSTAASFSLMAGADYRLTESLTIDAGYRYTRLVDVGLNSDSSDLANIDGLNVHQVRLGLRYEVW